LISGPTQPYHDPARFLAVDLDAPALGVQQKIERLAWGVNRGRFASSQPVSSLENCERSDGGVASRSSRGGIDLPQNPAREKAQNQPE
jgi:hypothetical protein